MMDIIVLIPVVNVIHELLENNLTTTLEDKVKNRNKF